MTKEEQKKICAHAVDIFGEKQIDICIEEMAELTKELCKHKRGQVPRLQIAEEMADVYITLAEMELLFENREEVKDWIDRKLRRLKERIYDET